TPPGPPRALPPQYAPGPPRKLPTADELAKRPATADALAPNRRSSGLVAELGIGRFRLPRGGRNSEMAQDREGKWLAVPNGDVVAVFDARTGELSRTLTGHSDRVHAVAF